MKAIGDFEGLTGFTYTSETVKGEVTIFHPEDSDFAEVDYNSFQRAGSGSLKDIMAAIRLTKAAIKHYRQARKEAGLPACKFVAYPDDRDGHGRVREKIFSRFLSGLMEIGEYYNK